MHSPYRTLHDSYVPNRWSLSRLVSIVLTVACLAVLGFLISIVLLEKSSETTANRGAQYGERLWDALEDTRDLDDQSSMLLVESIPLYMQYEANATFGTSLYKAWRDLLTGATRSVDVASFYWSLTGADIGVNSSTDLPGREILRSFSELPSRNIAVRVASSIPSVANNSTDLEILKVKGVQVKMVDFGHLTDGVLHSKIWIIDMKHIYIGSANMDWRSLTQVKELGVVIYNCPRLAEDLQKIFQSYWVLGDHNATVPDPWPLDYETSINKESPLVVNLSSAASRVYISSSPHSFCPAGRTEDVDAILSVIKGAELFIDASVMEYFPTSRYTKPQRYWPVIDDALKQSAFDRHVPIRLLISCGRDTDPAMFPFLRSLSALHNPAENISIEVKLFIVPVGNQSDIPYSRVNHNKYMVTDKVAYIGTSNWSADYFWTTAGVGLVVSQDTTRSGQTLQEQLRGVFQRDWNSQYTVSLSDVGRYPDCRSTERAQN